MNSQFKEAYKKTLMRGRYDGEITNQINKGSVAIMVRPIDMNSNRIDTNISKITR